MKGGNHSEAERQSFLHVTHREGLALLAALELAPFEDEVLTQKLLDLVYSPEKGTHPKRRLRSSGDFAHHPRR